MYAFVSNIRQLAQNDMGVKYLFQEPFDDEQEQHRRLTSNLSSEPDAIVGIFWCQPMERIRRPGSLAATHTSKGATETGSSRLDNATTSLYEKGLIIILFVGGEWSGAQVASVQSEPDAVLHRIKAERIRQELPRQPDPELWRR